MLLTAVRHTDKDGIFLYLSVIGNNKIFAKILKFGKIKRMRFQINIIGTQHNFG